MPGDTQCVGGIYGHLGLVTSAPAAIETPSTTHLLEQLAGLESRAVILVECRSGSFAFDTAAELAQHATVQEDLTVLVPGSDRYSAEEIDGVLHAAMLRPLERNGIVVDADSIPQQLVARLLKTLESPSAPTWFVLSTADASRLSAPLIGRVSRILRVEPQGVDSVIAELALHCEEDQARTIVELCSPRPELALQLILEGSSKSTAKSATTKNTKAPDSKKLDALVGNLEVLQGFDPDSPAGAVLATSTALTALTSRSDVSRDLLRLVLDRSEQLARTKLRASDPDGVSIIEAIERSRSLLERFSSTSSVLSALCAPVRQAL